MFMANSLLNMADKGDPFANFLVFSNNLLQLFVKLDGVGPVDNRPSTD